MLLLGQEGLTQLCTEGVLSTQAGEIKVMFWKFCNIESGKLVVNEWQLDFNDGHFFTTMGW